MAMGITEFQYVGITEFHTAWKFGALLLCLSMVSIAKLGSNFLSAGLPVLIVKVMCEIFTIKKCSGTFCQNSNMNTEGKVGQGYNVGRMADLVMSD